MSVIEEIKEQCPYTVFPTDVDSFDRKIDISLDILNIMNQYENFIRIGDMESANALLNDNPKLRQATVTQEDINRLRDGLIAIQMMWTDYISRYLVEFSQPKGEWSDTAKYTKYNAVTYEFENAVQTYIGMKIDIPIGTLPTDTNYWTCITMRGEKGDSGTGLTIRGEYDYDTNYYPDDFVVHNNALWYAKKENIHQIPNKASSSWGCLMEFTAELLKYNNFNSTLSANTFQSAVDELDAKVNQSVSDIKSVKLATLLADKWSDTAPYTQTVDVEDITQNDEPIISIHFNDDVTAQEVKAQSKSFGFIDRGITTNKKITFYCYNKKPTVDFVIAIKGE